MKRIIVVLVLVFAAVAGTLMAQTETGHARPFGPRPGLFPMLHQLNLTDAQKDQIKALARADHQTSPPKGFELEQQLHAAIFGDKADPATLESLKSSINAAHAEELDRRIEHLQKLAEILTPDQKQQLLTLQAQHAAGRRGQ